MEDLIAIVNRLQDTFSVIGSESVDLPQIVVVGSQSSGKSSVLETIVGRDFLPRGSGIVTRRPLVLQLINSPAPAVQDLAVSTYEDAIDDTPSHVRAHSQPSSRRPLPRTLGRISPNPQMRNGTAHSEENGLPYTLGGNYPLTEWGEFLHIPNRRFEYADIKREIEAETFRVAGQNKGISKLPIHLKIHSPHVLNLTLVDLPGLTKIPVGDQPSDIEKQIRNLVTDYIARPNSVILAISPANVDLANSDSLKLARQVDPRGRRTIGVLTKLDLMDNGTNALDILTGRVYPLKLGFVGVVNRSQGDIISGKPLTHAIDDEKEFFRNHPAYRSISHRCGISYLAKTLNHVLMAHIREKLPDIKARLNTLMGQTQQELNTYGDATFLGESHRGSLVLKLMTQFARDFVASIDGTSYDISTKELSGGARIYYIFNDVFGTALETINPIANLSTMDIRTAIRNSTGPRPSLFVPENAFDLLIKPQIKLLEAPSQRCVELVYEELMKICHNCTSNELQRFPRLHAKLIEVVSDLLRERLGPTAEYVESLIAIQQAYINTNHPSFVNGAGMPHVDHKRLDRKSRPESRRIAVTNGTNPEANDPAEEHESQVSDQASVSPDERASALIHGAVTRSRKISGVIQSKHSQYPGSPNLSHRTHQQDLTTPQIQSQQPQSTSTPAGNSARDQFLNYFFGNSSATKSDGLLPELEAVGAKSRESLDMKSLEKHLELIPADMDGHLTEREEMETSLIRSLISSYFDITRQSIADLVPKAVMHLLVNFSRESVQNRLVTQLYDETLFTELLAEDDHVAAERQKLKSLYEAYKQAFLAISSF